MEAGKLLVKNGLVNVILLVKEKNDSLSDEIQQEVISLGKQEAYAIQYFELRKGKDTLEVAKKILIKRHFMQWWC
ncbi:hypothetical protein NW070_01265 [Mycoplasmopsis cynos]|nr:hypothetical protein [Mycoplasmopsis cynos]UWV77926.1 hypothetical protein NW070_01265 [Mycoplasmopsis cynos]